MIRIIVLTIFQQIAAEVFPFKEYTHVANTFAGAPCLTGCDSQNECVVNWEWRKGNCRTFEVAPIFRTAQMRDPLRKYCLSNCGYFGEKYEWCITTEDLKWDFCSSQQTTTFLPSGHPASKTRYGVTCINQCEWSENDKYNWCRYEEVKWEYCALPALPRIPVLRDNFHIGEKKKGNCDGFMKYVTSLPSLNAADAADDYVTGIADAIEKTTVMTNTVSQVLKVSDPPIESYAVVKVKDLMVPAVVRAHITNATIGRNDASNIPEAVERKLRQQMGVTGSSFEAVQLIGSRLGGPSSEYNIVPRSINWKCDEWWDMEVAVQDWCRRTGGSVDMTVVVFYRDQNTPIPHAFGVSLVYKNSDNSVFVECREKVHYNYF